MTGRRIVTGLSTLLLALVGWLLLAPQQLGGPVAIVTTYGTSMLPTYTASDLVVVVEADDYDVGDVVAYRSEELGAVVLHRIVDVDEEGYVTQGDNNDWLDPDRPTDDELMGTARLRVPGAGRLLELPTPVRAVVIAGLGLLAIFGGRTAKRRHGRRPDGSVPSVDLLPTARRRRGNRRRRRSEDGMLREREFAWVGWPLQLGLVAGGLGLLSLLLGAVAFARPTSQPGELSYSHHGEFSYESQAPRGVVYPDGKVTTGDPVFLTLVDSLEVSFQYTFAGPAADLETTGQLVLEITDGSGWSRSSPLGDEQQGAEELRLEGGLDVTEVQRTLERVQEQTGIAGGGGTITLIAETEVTGTVAGEPVSERFAPQLAMQLSEGRLVPDADANDAAGGITVAQDGAVAVVGLDPARLEFGGRGIEISTARPLAVILFGSALLALAVASIGAARQGDLDDATRLHARYGSRFVEIEAMQSPGGYGLVDVRDMGTLMRLADQHERPVLHQQSGRSHTYLVEGDATVYRYRLQGPKPADGRSDPR